MKNQKSKDVVASSKPNLNMFEEITHVAIRVIPNGCIRGGRKPPYDCQTPFPFFLPTATLSQPFITVPSRDPCLSSLSVCCFKNL